MTTKRHKLFIYDLLLTNFFFLNALFFLGLIFNQSLVCIGFPNLEKTCNHTRVTLSDLEGTISDGPGDYASESHCEWLIEAPVLHSYITLNITSLDTECSYDHLYIYDGTSYTSPLLAVFSGKSNPQEIVASSGYMLLLLYSDTNYERSGFEAYYYISNCPQNCSGRGFCNNHMCICEEKYSGPSCEKENCPENCGVHQYRGNCVLSHSSISNVTSPQFCLCNEGYFGESCSLSSISKGDNWHWINRNEFRLTPRTAHGSIYIAEMDRLYIFGGYTLNDPLNDLLGFSFSENSFTNYSSDGVPLADKSVHTFSHFQEAGDKSKIFMHPNDNFRFQNLTFSVNEKNTVSIQLKKNFDSKRDKRMVRPGQEHINLKEFQVDNKDVFEWPGERFGHCMEVFGTKFVLYGGRLATGKLSSELWLFNTVTSRWKQLETGRTISYTNSQLNTTIWREVPPGLVYCSLTLVDNEWIYLFGGNIQSGKFSNRMFRKNLNTLLPFEEVIPLGGKPLKARVVGHSAVFHKHTRSLYFYGGIKVDISRFSKLSDQLLVFNVDSNLWSEIHYPKLYGSNEFFTPPLERAFHTATVAGNYMIIFGGYMHKHKEEETCYDQKIYMFHLGCHVWLSPILLPEQQNGSFPRKQGLYGHTAFLRNGNTLVVVGGFRGTVTSDILAYVLPSTLVASSDATFNRDEACREHSERNLCVSNLECGWCTTDSICYDRTKSINCTTNLQTSTCPGICPSLITCQACVVHGASSNCAWCVKTQRCQASGLANNYARTCGSPHLNQAWWGNRKQLLTDARECALNDIPPGLTSMKYRYPFNYSQPDSVVILRDFKELRNQGNGRELRELQTRFHTKFRLMGFLHPMYMEYGTANKLYQSLLDFRLILEGNLNATLSLSTSDTPDNLEEVAYIIKNKVTSSVAKRMSRKPLISSPSSRLLIRLDVYKPIQVASNNSINMSILWALGPGIPHSLSINHLEPFGRGNDACFKHGNCLSCLSDSLCGWCRPLRGCYPRDVSGDESCPEHNFLILSPDECELCEDFIYCDDCLQLGSCEWLAEKGHCTRRGRFPDSIKDLLSCPTPCHERVTCVSCLGDPGLCAWCQSTKECFLFSVYTSVYQHGACRSWMDEDHTNLTTIKKSRFGFGECKVCEEYDLCERCLEHMECGWCYDEFNPTIGLCTSGDFSSPYSGNCSTVESAINGNMSLSRKTDGHSSQWAYSACPDINECLLGLHDCHPKATCTNTIGYFNCTCPKGFIGNGRNSCERTCYNLCVKGVCSGSPNFKCLCDLGWTGEDCAINCGCNNHSTCEKVGECHHCQAETMGKYCHLCKPGSYGNATTFGCKKCECNSHWDKNGGMCNRTNGDCFCIHNTYGTNCNKCLPGFYGDPRNGGRCYHQCSSRGIILNATEGYFGSQIGSKIIPQNCLWIISAHDSLISDESMLKGTVIIQVTLLYNEINCKEGSLYVYEGLPNFVSVLPETDNKNFIGTFCKQFSEYPITLEAKSGIITIFFEKIYPLQGFRASYAVIRCPLLKNNAKICVDGKPVCPEEWRGVSCDVPVCPNRCYESEGHGKCDGMYGRCLCNDLYVGEDCGTLKKDHHVTLQELFNPIKIGSSISHLRTVLPRFGQTLICDHRGSLWLFGGYSLSRGPLNDIQQFDTKNMTWVQVTVNVHPGAQPPQPRYFHSSEYVSSHNEMYVFGGMNKTSFLGDFWKFNIPSESWAPLPVADDLPSLAGHTLSCYDCSTPQSLVLIGGVSEMYGLLEVVWQFNINTYKWSRVDTSGAQPAGIFCHSTVYHEQSQTFYVFGGYLYYRGSVILNNRLFALDYTTKHWSILPPDYKINHNPASRPAPRAFHGAVTTDEYMIVLGGYISERERYKQDIMVYSYECNMWIPLNNHFITLAGYELSIPIIGVSAAYYQSSIYLFAGFSGTVRGTLTKISLPEDLCTLNSNKTQCRDRIGCANCVVYNDKGNTSYCYSNARTTPDSCLRATGKLTSLKGIQCDNDLFERRECYQYKTCLECLTSWPSHRNVKQNCHWCLNCLEEGLCVPGYSNCSDYPSCRMSEFDYAISKINNLDLCPTLECAAPDCSKCHQLEHCIWASKVHYNTDKRHPNDWQCTKHVGNFSLVEALPQDFCSNECHTYRTCSSCLHEDPTKKFVRCYWSSFLRKCISARTLSLQCLGDACGHLFENEKQCPSSCGSYRQCHQCLSQVQCGWCAVGTSIGGFGICTEGRLEGPWRGRCSDLNFQIVANFKNLSARFDIETDSFLQQKFSSLHPITWHYDACPWENECLNSHHNCDTIKEVCIDSEQGFSCSCAKGYSMNDGGCQPVCDKGCIEGSCVRPNVCHCNFGYVGQDCSVGCNCHGHSNCAGPDQLNVCLKCHNNTVGTQCQKCVTNYVGNPVTKEDCKSCKEYCYGHTNLCTVKEQGPFGFNESHPYMKLYEMVNSPPLIEAACLNCSNNTTGPRCNTCLPGFFRGTTNPNAHCRPCECNGHSSVCDLVWGHKCDCQNNTETPCGKEEKDCWKKQCSECKKNYTGNPKNGHQCYRTLKIGSKHCLDPLQTDCLSYPGPLHNGKVSMFAVQPNFNNVDIRLYIDISKGGVDVYFTTFEGGFIVKVNETSWEHNIITQKSFPLTNDQQNTEPDTKLSAMLSARYDLMAAISYIAAHNKMTNKEDSDLYYNYLHKISAEGLKTYFTLRDSKNCILVKNLTNRLVITLPNSVHNLEEKKFYVIIRGVGNGVETDSFGSIYFRQDLPRTDLFVFFSVFFSCFFLFLSACVIFWKVMQGIDYRRAQQRHIFELIHLAKRPFASITIILQSQFTGSAKEVRPVDPSLRAKQKRTGSVKTDKSTDSIEVEPLALEPTADLTSAVITVAVQLPACRIGKRDGRKEDEPPHRIALGSTLCIVSTRSYPPNSKTHIMRGTSHSSA